MGVRSRPAAEVVGRCRGFLVLLRCALEPPFEAQSRSVLQSVLHVLNAPATRGDLLRRGEVRGPGDGLSNASQAGSRAEDLLSLL